MAWRASTARRSTSTPTRAKASTRTGTRYIYNFGRREVQGFLIASALHWLEHFHVDGLRVDAVASMLYRDYSRKPANGCPTSMAAARTSRRSASCASSTRGRRALPRRHDRSPRNRPPGPASPRRSTRAGSGFTFKWNMGWMHDTLHYMAARPGPSRAPSQRHDLRPDLCLLGELRPAAVA